MGACYRYLLYKETNRLSDYLKRTLETHFRPKYAARVRDPVSDYFEVTCYLRQIVIYSDFQKVVTAWESVN